MFENVTNDFIAANIVLENDRQKLPSFVEMLNTQTYITLRPFDGRSQQWDATLKSLLIESLIVNIPVPPLILFQTGYKTYDVIDGQQRIIAIQNFYNNQLTLKGLRIFSYLNGYQYQNLPATYRAKLNRCSISWTAILPPPELRDEDREFLKLNIFERFHTS